MSFDWKSLVRSVAPTIGASLGGPAGGMAVKFMADKFLGKPDATEAELMQAIRMASPTDMLALKRLDQEFALQMKALAIDVFKIETGDRQNARDLFKTNIWPQIILSSIFVIGYFVLLGLIIAFHDIEFGDRVFGVLNTIIGVLTAAIPMILQFWFGSSTGSKDKDRISAMGGSGAGN